MCIKPGKFVEENYGFSCPHFSGHKVGEQVKSIRPVIWHSIELIVPNCFAESLSEILKLLGQLGVTGTREFKDEILRIILTNQKGLTNTPTAEQRHQLRSLGVQRFLKGSFFGLPTYKFFHEQDLFTAKTKFINPLLATDKLFINSQN